MDGTRATASERANTNTNKHSESDSHFYHIRFHLLACCDYVNILPGKKSVPSNTIFGAFDVVEHQHKITHVFTVFTTFVGAATAATAAVVVPCWFRFFITLVILSWISSALSVSPFSTVSMCKRFKKKCEIIRCCSAI